MQILSPLKYEPRYAVQEDISDCNLYCTKDGELGVFDFNRCGDNNLYCNAVMQSVFESRLTVYPESYTESHERRLLAAFLHGYQSERPFTEEQQRMFPFLCAIIRAFWSGDIKRGDDSLVTECKKGDSAAILRRLEKILYEIANPEAIRLCSL